MRVLHVATPSPSGRVERLVTSMAGAQRGQGDEVHVATLSTSRDPSRFLDELGARNITAHAMCASGRDYRAQQREIEALGHRLRPDIVHTHGCPADVLAAKACRRTGAAVVTTMHGSANIEVQDRRREWLRRRAMRECDGIVAVSEAMAVELLRQGVPRDRLHLIPDTIPLSGPQVFRGAARRALEIPSEQWVIGWAGSLQHADGLDLLLEALALLPDPTLGLAVLGDGPERDRLIRQARALRIDDRVTWCGAVPAAERFVSGFDLLAVSARDRVPATLLREAMGAFIPIVATSSPDLLETITPATAVVVPPENPLELAAAIHFVRAYPGSAARRSLRAYVRRSRSSDVGRWAQTYSRVYEAAIAKRRAGREREAGEGLFRSGAVTGGRGPREMEMVS